MLNKAKSVTILGGAGCAGAHDELMEVAKTLKSPIVSALRGREHIQYENPYDVGLTGLIGFSSGYHAIKECDTLLMLGTDFPYTQFYPEKSTIVQVDRRGENLGRRTRLDLGLALEKHQTGAKYHAVAEEGVPMRDIAEAIGRGLKIPVVSLSLDEAAAHFGWLTMFAGSDLAASSEKTRKKLGWNPTGPGLISDLDQAKF